MRPKRFGTFEKWVPGAHIPTEQSMHKKKITTHNISDDMTVDDFEVPNWYCIYIKFWRNGNQS